MLIQFDNDYSMVVNKDQLTKLVHSQIKNFFNSTINIESYQEETLSRVAKCFNHCGNKYYHENGMAVFSPFHSGQYSIYLYYLANTIFKREGRNEVSDQLYYLNKTLNSVEWYYEIEFPDVFCVDHPLGSVMGRASYSDRFLFIQGCTVGGNKGVYPTIGENVIMYANATIIGDSKIGKNVLISSGTLIKDEMIPDNCIVYGKTPNLVVKLKTEKEIRQLTDRFWK